MNISVTDCMWLCTIFQRIRCPDNSWQDNHRFTIIKKIVHILDHASTMNFSHESVTDSSLLICLVRSDIVILIWTTCVHNMTHSRKIFVFSLEKKAPFCNKRSQNFIKFYFIMKMEHLSFQFEYQKRISQFYVQWMSYSNNSHNLKIPYFWKGHFW